MATWTNISSPVSKNLHDVAFGSDNVIVVVGDDNTILTSEDYGNTFTLRTTTASSPDWRRVIWDGSKFVAVGYGGTIRRVSVSNDGVTWTILASISVSADALSFNGSRYVVAGFNGLTAYSDDLSSWNNVSVGSSSFMRCSAYGNGLFVVGGDLGEIYTSVDGESWTPRKAPEDTDDTLHDMMFLDGEFFAVGSSGRTWRSLDGITWSHGGTGIANSYSIDRGEGEFFSGGSGETILVSPDFLLWTTEDTSGVAGPNLLGGSYLYGLYVVVGDSGEIWTKGVLTPPVTMTIPPLRRRQRDDDARGPRRRQAVHSKSLQGSIRRGGKNTYL